MSLNTLLPFIPLSGAASVGFFLAMSWVVHVVSDHAAKHQGDEVEARNCLAQQGEWQVWRESGGRYHRLCHTPAGEIFDQIVAWTGERWEEVTAFRPNPWGRGNVWPVIRQWLERKGATPYKGPLPPPTR